MKKSISEADLSWLIYNTEISNFCASADDCFTQNIVFHIYRPHHKEKIHQIFSDCKITDMKDSENNDYAEISNFTIEDLYSQMREKGGDMFLNATDGRIYYIPLDKNKNRRIFNCASTRMLANLPSNKKINILKSLRQKCYMTASGRDKSDFALAKKTDKILALLQIQIPQQFVEDELRKVRLITAEIAKIPNIKEYIERFAKLSAKKKQDILRKVCEITAKYNNIDMPTINFLTQKQVDKEEGIADWISEEAFAYEKNVCINKDILNKIDGVQALSLAWHETTHVAQAYADYSKYPLVEEMFNQSMDYLQKMPETYLFHPQEKVTYTLEKQFVEKIVENTGIKTNDSTFIYNLEYNIATQYLHRAQRIKS